MNSCILMAKVVRNPELRYTQDNQTPIAQMLVEFEGLRSEDAPTTLKVVGWGNLASEIQETYSEGDRLIIEGRLSMNTFDRPEGFKEKRAELVASRIYRLDGSYQLSSASSQAIESSQKEVDSTIDAELPTIRNEAKVATVASSTLETEPIDQNLDDIPF